MIATPDGEVAVEALREGDLVTTLTGEAKRIRWVGQGDARITDANRCDIAPVIVRRGALGVGAPAYDLYLTRKHAVLVEDVLVPVELLVNDHSIVWDDDAARVLYYHLELDDHDVLLANGAPAESLRDDGSLHLFDNAFGRPAGGWQGPSRFPVVDAGPRLERAWRAVAARVGTVPDALVTTDPDLHLAVGGGRISAHAVENGTYRFRLRRPTGDVLLSSRHTIPAAMGSSTDQRRLGVAVTRLTVEGEGATTTLCPASSVLRDGFHPVEGGHRWTKGRAVLPWFLFQSFGVEMEVSVDVAATLSYRADLLSVAN
jgi:hypothetical protein